ncbi:hypothetical protein AAMO2058_000586000 [Amorphochlora amoebiformis]
MTSLHAQDVGFRGIVTSKRINHATQLEPESQDILPTRRNSRRTLENVYWLRDGGQDALNRLGTLFDRSLVALMAIIHWDR